MGKIFDNSLTPEILEQLFRSDEKCIEFIADLKWTDGFICRKCGNPNYCKGKSLYSRRCTKCKSEESATTGTIFHQCRFPISKAFYIAYNVCKGNEEVSSYEFSRRLSLRQMTCWNFKSKIQTALKSMDSLTDKEKKGIQKMLNG